MLVTFLSTAPERSKGGGVVWTHSGLKVWAILVGQAWWWESLSVAAAGAWALLAYMWTWKQRGDGGTPSTFSFLIL